MKPEKQFFEVVQLIKQARTNAFKAANTELINVYWQVGEYISKRMASTAWGNKTVEELANFIQNQHPDLKGFNRRGLYRMKQFYETYCQTRLVSIDEAKTQSPENHQDIIVSPVVTQLERTDIRNSILAKTSWTNHLIILSGSKTEEEREFYIRLCVRENYGKRELERQINSGVFERVMMGSQQISVIAKELSPDISGIFKDNYVFEFLNLPPNYSERDLQKALISQMKNFILELGKDYLFVGEEYRLQVGTRDFEVDLLFFHRGLQCLIAIELKTESFKPEHLGKLNFYLEALDRDVKKEHEKPSIGILLCKDHDTEVVKYALSRSLSPAMVAAYQTQLPDKKLLQQKLHELFKERNNHE